MLFTQALLAMTATVGLTQAAIVEFDIAPTDTSAGVGLRFSNVSPSGPVSSLGSGNEVAGGISYDTDTNLLSVAFGYGSAAGFTDLTGAATAVHIHGPAAVGATGPLVSDLGPITFNASQNTKGGVVIGTIAFSEPQEADLLANLDYVDIHTASNSGGDLRGQLVRVNVAPVIVCDEELTVECGKPFTFDATVSDFDANAVSVVFTLNGEDVKRVDIAQSSPPAGNVVSLTTNVHNEVNILTITATDSAGNETICDIIVNAEDTIAPVIKSLDVNPKVLWPPNHKMVPVMVDAQVQDACGETTFEIVSITSSQAEDAKGSGNTAPDFVITGDHTANLRAERTGKDKAGRIYTIRVQATDEAGNESEIQTVTVKVPHSQGK